MAPKPKLKPWPKKSQTWTLVFSGRITYAKNFVLVCAVVAELQRRGREKVKFAVFGNFDGWGAEDQGQLYYAEYIREVIRSCILTRWKSEPEFFGTKSPSSWFKCRIENPVFFSLSTLFQEDFGLALAQAQAQGWPAIVSEWGGHIDIPLDSSIKIPYELIGRPSSDSKLIRAKAEKIADCIEKELLARRKTKGPARFAPARARKEAAPKVLTPEKINVALRDAFRKHPEVLSSIQKSGFFRLSKTKAGRRFLENYYRAFSDPRIVLKDEV